MKVKLLNVLMLITLVYTMNSCSTDGSENTATSNAKLEKVNFSYDSNEILTMELINEYRVSVGLKVLNPIAHVSFKSEEHDNYMITNNVVNHNDFVARSENIMQVLGAKKVSENIAYNYNSPAAALNAWLKSPSHKSNIEGDFTDFGIAIRQDVNGKKYYTNIFIKK